MRPGDATAQTFVAVREQPVERLVGAAVWRVVEETDGSRSAEFEWSVIPSVPQAEEIEFLRALVAHVRERCPHVIRIAPSGWLPVAHPQAEVLQAVGFTVAGQRRQYEAEAPVWREALAKSFATSGAGRVIAPCGEHFEALKSLLCGPSLRPSELADGFQTAHTQSPGLFDPRCSAVLTEDGKITAACLANSSHGLLCIAALAGGHEECARLVHHCLQARDGIKEPASLVFHLDDRDPPAALGAWIDQFPMCLRGIGQYYQLRFPNGENP